MSVIEAEANDKEECCRLPEIVDPSSAARAEIHQKLRAVEFEIGAVSSTIQRSRNDDKGGECSGVDEDNLEQGIAEGDSADGSNLQRVLAADRLRSLKNTKAQLEKELSTLSKDSASKGDEHEKLILSLVKEDRRPKRKLKQDKKLHKVIGKPKNTGKRLKTVSFDDDVDFDTALDAASAGFVETVSYLLIITSFFVLLFHSFLVLK